MNEVVREFLIETLESLAQLEVDLVTLEKDPAEAATSVVVETPVGEVMETRAPHVADSTIRVDVGLLDKLMTLVGELVLARNQMVQLGTTEENPGLLSTVQRLDLLTTELQAG